MKFEKLLAGFAVLIGVFAFGHSPALAQLSTVLLGGNEVSATGAANAGDPDGGGTAAVVISDTTLCYGILVTGIDTPTLAHIHEGAAGVNGPIVVDFVPPETGDPGASSDCIADADPAVLDRIRQNPLSFYVNVHNDIYPGGAVRGQLSGSVPPAPPPPPPPARARLR